MSALQDVLRERATKYLMRNGHVPPKARTKPKGSGFRRQDRDELAKHPGSSRSRILDHLRAVAAKHTGAVIASTTREAKLGQLGLRKGKVVVVKRHQASE